MKNLSCNIIQGLKTFLILLAGLLQLACAEDQFPKYVELGGLRVLAIRAEVAGRAEASPGETVLITPFVSDYGNSRSLSFEAKACLDSGVAVGAEPTCEGQPGAVLAGSGAVTITGAERTGAAPDFSVVIPAGILDSRSSDDRFNGVSYLVTYRLVASDGTAVQSFKRIVVSESTKTTKNLNPSVSGILGSGSTLTVYPTADVELTPVISAGSQESYSFSRNGVTGFSRTEELVTTWFISHGEIKFFRTVGSDSTLWTPAALPLTGNPILVAVLRDDRGGVSTFVQALAAPP